MEEKEEIFSQKDIYQLLTCFIMLSLVAIVHIGIRSVFIFFAELNTLSISEKFQVIASSATAFTAYFSWRAVRQAEEINFKPIMAIGSVDYFSGVLSINVINLSKEGDRWARNIKIRIPDSNKSVIRTSYLGPSEEDLMVIENIEMNECKGRSFEVSYMTFNNKVYKLTYIFLDEVISGSSTIRVKRIK